MDPELKRQLAEIHALARDNHRLLRAVRRHQFLIDFGRFILWLVILAVLAFYYFTYLKPLAERFVPGSATTSAAFFQMTSGELQKLINSYRR